MPAWMKWQKQFLPERFERFARVMFNKQDADAGIEALKNWYAKIGAPVTLSEGQIPEIDIPMLVDKLFAVAGMWGATQLYTKDMIRTVLQNAL
ncbi:hypothetical protein SDC9_94674 [bioreactor metagenome]|uniref:Fe-containing alcohol dehydrogenase-like C-terminal domain-containing protein n=1 Tax=bioreactor metagenome TaxID=1076179 RepID=A0A645AAV4_9ZZZZ